MYNSKKKQKTVTDKDFQQQIKQIKNNLAEGKAIVQHATCDQDYQQAIQILNKAISKSTSIQISNSYLLLYYRGICYLNLKEYNKAERDFVQGSSLADDKGKIQIYNYLGRCKCQMAEEDPSYYQQAIDSYQKAIQFSKNTDGQSQLKLAQIYRKLKNNKQAIKHYTNSLKSPKFTQQFQSYMQRGLCYRQNNQLKNSIQDFIKACQIKKDQSQAYFNLGINYLLDFKYQTALQNFDIAIQLNSSQPRYKNYKGLTFYMNKQYQNCLSIYKQALKLYSQQNISNSNSNTNSNLNMQVSQCWYNLGNAYLHLHQQQQAIASYKMAENYQISQQQKIKIYYSLGLAYQNMNNIQAINKFQQCLILIGDNTNINNNNTNNINNNISTNNNFNNNNYTTNNINNNNYTTNNTNTNNNKQHQLYLSSIYHLSYNQYIHHKYIQALHDINIIINQQCHDKYVYQLRGKIYLQIYKYEQSLKDFQKVLTYNPNNPQIYYYLGMVKSNLGQIDNAIIDFFKSVDLGCRNINNIMNGISYAYLKLNKPQKALVYINIVLDKYYKQDKLLNNQNYLIQRSMVYLQLNQYHKAIQDLSDALKINNKNSYTYYRRGLTYYKSKKFNQAIQDLYKSLYYQPNQYIQSDIYYLIGVSYANKQQYQNAIQPFSKAIDIKKISKYYHQRAKCYILLDKGKQAIQDLNQVIKLQPNNAYAYFRRGLAYKLLKMYEESAQNFMKARQLSPDDPKLILNKKQIYQIKFRKLCEPGEEQ